MGRVSREAEAIIRRAYAAFAARDADALAELSDPGIEISTVTGVIAGREGPYRGRQGIDEYLADIGKVWKRIELFPQSFHHLDAERILVFGRVRAWREKGFTDAANAWLWTLRGGRVLRVQVFADPGDARDLITGA
jgi:ketosteroid isomerase-like protein